MRQILLIALLLLIVDVLSLKQEREERLNDEEPKQPIKNRKDNKAPVGKTASLGSRDEDVQKNKPGDQGKGAGVFGRIGETRIDKSSKSQPDGGAANSEDKIPQSVSDGAKYDKKKPKSGKDATEPTDKRTKPDGVGDKPTGKTSQSDGDSGEPRKPPHKEDEAGPRVEPSNDGGEKPKSLPSGKERKSTSNDSKSNPDKLESPKVAENEVDDENDDDDRGVQKPGTLVPPKVEWNDDNDEEEIQLKPMENAIAQESVRTIGKVGHPSETSSSSSFVTYFIIAVVIVIVIYLLFHNKKKLMAYVIEGRNTGRVRRNRGTSGAEYKPLNNPEELTTGCRTESA